MPTASLAVGGYLAAYLLTRLRRESATYTTAEGISVFFDGYLSDVVGLTAPRDFIKRPAQTIATLYQKHAGRFLLTLRGSYTGLVVDEGSGDFLLFCDRRGSRPVFYKHGDNGSLIVAPEVRFIASLLDPDPPLNSVAVAEFAMSGKFYGNHTLFQDIFSLPQGGTIRATTGAVEIDRYWNLQFGDHAEGVAEEELIDECDSLYRQATRRLVKVVERPVLLLSGGIDSRILLGALLAEGGDGVSLATFAAPEVRGDDAEVARKVADLLGMPLREFAVHMSDFVDTATEAVARADGRVQVIDAPQLFRIWDELGHDSATVFKGDECFGWHAAASSVDTALNRNFLYRLPQMSRLSDWLRRDVVDTVQEGVDAHLDAIAAAAAAETEELMDVKDKLYYGEQIGNYVNPFTGLLLRTFEQARPLIDEDVVEFVKTLPPRLRGDKSFLQRLLKKKYPDLAQVPAAQRYSMPTAATFRKFFAEEAAGRQFVTGRIESGLDPRLDSLIDARRFSAAVESLLTARAMPPLQGDWLVRIPLAWRLRRGRPVKNYCDPIILMLRLLQMDIFLKSVESIR
jgi:asparagine synthetase B (glutamine-hydrolysing)